MLGDYTATIMIGVVAAASAGLLRGATGFGSALVIAPVLSHLLGPQQAVVISLMIGASATLFMAPRHRTSVNWPVVTSAGLAGLVLLIPGVMLLRLADPEIMKRVIGLVTLAAALLMLLFHARSLPSGPVPQMLAGALGGLLMGATSMGGPPVVLYLVSRHDSSEEKKANVIYVVGLLEVGALVLFAISGGIEMASLRLFALFLPAFAVGMYLGRMAFGFIGERYRSVVLVVLLLIGLIAVWG